jgi:hypothetical protein
MKKENSCVLGSCRIFVVHFTLLHFLFTQLHCCSLPITPFLITWLHCFHHWWFLGENAASLLDGDGVLQWGIFQGSVVRAMDSMSIHVTFWEAQFIPTSSTGLNKQQYRRASSSPTCYAIISSHTSLQTTMTNKRKPSVRDSKMTAIAVLETLNNSLWAHNLFICLQ